MRDFDSIGHFYKSLNSGNDLLGFRKEAVVAVLADEDLALVFKDDPKYSHVKSTTTRRYTEFTVKAETYRYLTFAIDKAKEHRGISATRSVEKLMVWMWMMEKVNHPDEHTEPYVQYGVPILKWIASEIAYPWPVKDRIIDAMALGQVCPDCIAGSRSGCASGF